VWPGRGFRRQLDYLGDFRVHFDYFFPRLIPGDATYPPDISQEQWDTVYVPAITAALRARPARLDALLRVGRAPFDPNEPQPKIEAALGILWYQVFATNDAKVKLGGNPFDNSRRLYLGSGHDFWLNLLVDRFHADPPALAAIEAAYQTCGELAAPLITLHTTADPIVPYWHEPLYSLKTLLGGSGLLHVNLPVFRYGPCSFRAEKPWSASSSSSSRWRGGSWWTPSASCPPSRPADATVPWPRSTGFDAEPMKLVAVAGADPRRDGGRAVADGHGAPRPPSAGRQARADGRLRARLPRLRARAAGPGPQGPPAGRGPPPGRTAVSVRLSTSSTSGLPWVLGRIRPLARSQSWAPRVAGPNVSAGTPDWYRYRLAQYLWVMKARITYVGADRGRGPQVVRRPGERHAVFPGFAAARQARRCSSARDHAFTHASSPGAIVSDRHRKVR
jgi:hypothetical protein